MDRSEDTQGRIRLEIDERVATVTIERPHVRNAMNRALWVAIRTTFESLCDDGDGVRVMVLQGADGNFCAGSDIKEMQGRTNEDAEETFRLVEEALAALERIPVPVIGVLNGVAAGGGCELMLTCDLRVAGTSARIGMPVARLGITVSPAFVRRLVRVVGESRAGDLLLSGRLVGATEAHTWGLAHYLVEECEVEERAQQLARQITAFSPASLRQSKQLLRGSLAQTDARGESQVDEAHRFLGRPDEFWEGVTAFLEKREPKF